MHDSPDPGANQRAAVERADALAPYRAPDRPEERLALEAHLRARLRAQLRAAFRRHTEDPEQQLPALAEPVRQFASGLKRLGVPLEAAVERLRECVRESRPTPATAREFVHARAMATGWMCEVYARAD
jgi:hypothetical protein